MDTIEYSNSYLIEELKNSNVFSKFDEDQVKEFINLSELKKFEKGETIIKEGSLDNWMYFLLPGSIKR